MLLKESSNMKLTQCLVFYKHFEKGVLEERDLNSKL